MIIHSAHTVHFMSAWMSLCTHISSTICCLITSKCLVYAIDGSVVKVSYGKNNYSTLFMYINNMLLFVYHFLFHGSIYFQLLYTIWNFILPINFILNKYVIYIYIYIYIYQQIFITLLAIVPKIILYNRQAYLLS